VIITTEDTEEEMQTNQTVPEPRTIVSGSNLQPWITGPVAAAPGSV